MDGTIYLDTTDKQVKSLKIGESITVTVKGKVEELEASRTYTALGDEKASKADKIPPRLGVKVSSTKIEGKPNTFSRMADEDMAETNGD